MPAPPAADPVERISIEQMRQDAALVTRGAFLLALLPAIPLLQMAAEIVKDLPHFDAAKLGSPILWALLVATLGGLWYLRSYGGALYMRCLRGLIALQALVLLVGAAGIVAFAIPLASKGAGLESPWVPLAVLGGMVAFLANWVVLSPMRAARRLLATRLPPLGLPLPAALEELAKPAGAGPPALARQPATARSRAYGAAAWSIGLITAAIVLWLFAQGLSLPALAIEFAAIYAIIRLARRSRQLVAVDAGEQLRLDTRPPVLYLRSFQDDAELFAMESDIIVQTRVRPLSIGPWRTSGLAGRWRRLTTGWLSSSGGRLEEALALVVKPLGPFVAIGAPDEPLPELGAARTYFTNDTWQGAIKRWVDMAGLIVKVAGPTKWIRWELDTIIRQGALSKLIILLPPGRPEDNPQRWANIAGELADTPWGRASPASIRRAWWRCASSTAAGCRSSQAENGATSTIRWRSGSCFIS